MRELGFAWLPVVGTALAAFSAWMGWREEMEKRRAAQILLEVERRQQQQQQQQQGINWIWLAAGAAAAYFLVKEEGS